MRNSRWHRQPGKLLKSSITKSRFLDILDGLKLPIPLDQTLRKRTVMRFGHNLRGICSIFTKISFVKNFMEWSGQTVFEAV